MQPGRRDSKGLSLAAGNEEGVSCLWVKRVFGDGVEWWGGGSGKAEKTEGSQGSL